MVAAKADGKVGPTLTASALEKLNKQTSSPQISSITGSMSQIISAQHHRTGAPSDKDDNMSYVSGAGFAEHVPVRQRAIEFARAARTYPCDTWAAFRHRRYIIHHNGTGINTWDFVLGLLILCV